MRWFCACLKPGVAHRRHCVEMASFYRLVTSTNALPLDQSLLESLEKDSNDELAKLDERLAEAEKTEGESDIADALRARANHFTKIGDKVGSDILELSLVLISRIS